MGDYRKGFIAGYKEATKELKDCLKENTKGLKLSEEMKNVFIFSYNDILEIIDELILSKINSVSTQELKQTRGGELKSDEDLHSTDNGSPADIVSKEDSEDICICGHHTKDHSYDPNKLDADLECDICDCKGTLLLPVFWVKGQ